MNFQAFMQNIQIIFKAQVWPFIVAHPAITALYVLGAIIGFKFIIWFIRYEYVKRVPNVYYKVTLPREDNAKDQEKDTQKDFKEKIGVMQQCFRAIHEIAELNVKNIIYSWIFHSNIVSFELVCEKKMLSFYVVTVPYYMNIVEKQITSFYPDADITKTEPITIKRESGEYAKAFYAYQVKKFWYPIKTYKVMENDPLNDIANSMSKLSDKEKAYVQIIVRPKNQKWAKKAENEGSALFQGRPTSFFGKIPLIGSLYAVFTALFLGYDKMPQDKGEKDYERGYVRMLQTKEEVAKRVGEKATGTGFDAVVRFISISNSNLGAENIMNNLVVALNVFNDPASNSFQTKRVIPIDTINNRIVINNFNSRILESRFMGFGEKSSLLSEDELATMFHFPCSKYNNAPIIKWLSYKILAAPPDMGDTGLLIGYNSYRGVKKPIYFLDKDRVRHHYVIGKSGTGKSVFLSTMARQDIINGKGVAVIDPHGDLIEDILQYIPKERAKDVIVFNPSDQERPMGLNILEAKTPDQMDMASSQATEIFIKLFGDEIFGPRIQHYFRNACLTLMEDQEEGATLIDVPRIFTDDEFMKYKVSKSKNPIVRSFWEHEYAHTGDREKQEMIPYFSAKFGPFITNTIMRNTIGQTKSAFNFREIMDQGKILLVNLSKGKIGDLNTQLLGLIFVARLQMAAMSRADIPEEQRKDFFLYVDEFQNFATESFCSILSEARKYRLVLIMAHQYVSQLVASKFGTQSTQIRDAVFGNVGSMTIFRIGAEDAEFIAKEFLPYATEQDLVGIGNHKAYMKMLVNSIASKPFTLETVYDTSKASKKIADIVKEYSRLKYARKRDFVDQEIASRIGIDVSRPAEIPKL
ncbi:MAG: hypothetical protein US89_C0004G0015 [Candidatus Peregrinibacteria bacterium GW2011_GWF2_38_29]|nr:MAG: hypothetical protein US89_C0004G0015 [Candidatus Peregrinibacteria bacterium GW2011_GWF2_38_29]HBB02952.1 hypothetical protein [Candidatus Peregrinibacteria bacterium]